MSDEHKQHMEHCSVIKFLVQQNETNAEIVTELTSVYSTHVLKSTAMKKWVDCIQSGRQLMGDDARAECLATTYNVQKVKREIEKGCRKMIRDVAKNTDILCTSVHKILQQNLEMKKVCSSWFSKS